VTAEIDANIQQVRCGISLRSLYLIVIYP